MAKLRYRDHSGGVTYKSLKAANRNLYKLDTVTEIRGYRYTSASNNTYTTQHEAVLVKGPKGSMRFEGMLWSYSGEGPRGLVKLLEACGLNRYAAQAIAFNTPRKSEDGVDFTVKFPVPVPVNIQKLWASL
jgi:hypothetical protein